MAKLNRFARADAIANSADETEMPELKMGARGRAAAGAAIFTSDSRFGWWVSLDLTERGSVTRSRFALQAALEFKDNHWTLRPGGGSQTRAPSKSRFVGDCSLARIGYC